MVDTTKGCFLGQESVAKIRNLGRPPFLVVGLRADGPVVVGEPVLSAGGEVGRVTSALTSSDASVVLARVRYYEGAPPAFSTTSGVALS
jgi:hypothetical protein